MTDYERVKAFLTGLGVEFTEIDNPYERAKALRINDGLPGLYVQFKFFYRCPEEDDAFSHVGAYREGSSFACT